MKKLLIIFFMTIMLINLVACTNNGNCPTAQNTEQAITSYNSNQNNSEKHNTNTPVDEEPIADEPEVNPSMVDAFIDGYNQTAPTPITDAVEVDVTDKESGHYRTEFRLGAFKDSIAKTGNIGDIVIDIVNYGLSKDELRIYVNGIDVEQAKEIIQYASPVMDSNVTAEEIQSVLDYLDEYGDANGKYYGSLGLVFSGDELMITTD